MEEAKFRLFNKGEDLEAIIKYRSIKMVILLTINIFSFNAIIFLDKNFDDVWVRKAECELMLDKYKKALYR